MAAPDMTGARPGQVNGAGDDRALFLKVYGGEVLTRFREVNKALSRTSVRNITSGKSASFPATFKAAASYHTPGVMIVGQTILGNERIILIDDLAISPVFIANIDEAMSHFEFRSEYSFQAGASLSKQVDLNLFQLLLLDARASATITGGNGGTSLTAAAALTDADTLIAAAFDAAQALDEKDVPDEDRYIAVKPDQYYQLVNSSSKLINKDYGNEGNGSTASGKVMSVAGLEIVKTNHLPQGVVNTGPTAYQGTFTNTAAVVWHRSAVGTVKLIDLGVESDYLVQNQGTLIVAKQALGHGILRPESAVEIKTS